MTSPKVSVLADLTSALVTLHGMGEPGSAKVAALVSGAREAVELELAETAVPLSPVRAGVEAVRGSLRSYYLSGLSVPASVVSWAIVRLNGVLDDLGTDDG